MRKTAWNLKTFVVLSKHLIHFIYGVGNDVYRSESDIFADALWVRKYFQLFWVAKVAWAHNFSADREQIT